MINYISLFFSTTFSLLIVACSSQSKISIKELSDKDSLWITERCPESFFSTTDNLFTLEMPLNEGTIKVLYKAQSSCGKWRDIFIHSIETSNIIINTNDIQNVLEIVKLQLINHTLAMEYFQNVPQKNISGTCDSLWRLTLPESFQIKRKSDKKTKNLLLWQRCPQSNVLLCRLLVCTDEYGRYSTKDIGRFILFVPKVRFDNFDCNMIPEK